MTASGTVDNAGRLPADATAPPASPRRGRRIAVIVAGVVAGVVLLPVTLLSLLVLPPYLADVAQARAMNTELREAQQSLGSTFIPHLHYPARAELALCCGDQALHAYAHGRTTLSPEAAVAEAADALRRNGWVLQPPGPGQIDLHTGLPRAFIAQRPGSNYTVYVSSGPEYTLGPQPAEGDRPTSLSLRVS